MNTSDPHHISLIAVLCGIASASSLIPSTVNWLPINLQINTAGQSLTIRAQANRSRLRWHHLQECKRALLTRGGLNPCLLGSTQPSAELHHQSSRSALTYRQDRTDMDLYTESETAKAAGSNKVTSLPEYPEHVVFFQCFCQTLPAFSCDVVGWETGTKTVDTSWYAHCEIWGLYQNWCII